jgi:hypothetical protein
MGLDFLRAKEQSFTQKRDKSRIQQSAEEDMLALSKSDVFVPQFRCVLTDEGAFLDEGLGLIGRAFSETDVKISQRGKVIGFMLPEDAAELTRLMKVNHRHLGIISLTLEQAPAIDAIFIVKAKRPFKSRG